MSTIAMKRRRDHFGAICAFYREGTVILRSFGESALARHLLRLCSGKRPEEELGMAKRGRTLPARRQHVEDALLIRSAESLGRMIGTLQRQLDGASKKVSGASGMKMIGMDGQADGDGHQPRRVAATGVAARKRSRASTPAKGGSKSGVTKV